VSPIQVKVNTQLFELVSMEIELGVSSVFTSLPAIKKEKTLFELLP